MKILKEGIISHTEKGASIKGFIVNCEGGPIDLDEMIQYTKLKKVK